MNTDVCHQLFSPFSRQLLQAKSLSLIFAAFSAWVVAGCASHPPAETKAPREPKAKTRVFAKDLTRPSPGKAKVVFVRPDNFGAMYNFAIHDGDKLIGISRGTSFFAYECEPGKHLFTTSMEDVAVLDADLAADRIYYVKVNAVFGWVTPQVNLHPLYPGCAGDYWKKLPKVVRRVRETDLPERKIKQDAAGIDHYRERVKKYYETKYLTNPNREFIAPEHGQTEPVRG